MKKLFIPMVCLMLSSGFNLKAQTKSDNLEKNFDRAEVVFSKTYQNGKFESLTYSKECYVNVLPIFLDLYRQEPTNMNIAFKIGVSYLSSRGERAKAIPYFVSAINTVTATYKGSSYKEKKAPLIAIKFLGDAYLLNYQFDKAIEAYQKYISTMSEMHHTDNVLLAETQRKIEMCKTAKIMVADPVKIKIENLGTNVNSAFADYSPLISADQNTLFFTSRRNESTGGQIDDDCNYMEDIYMSSRTGTTWAAAVNIGAPINTDEHEATVGISPDGQTIYIYKDDAGDGNIYSTSLDGDVWSKPKKLNENINSKYWEPSASVSADGNTLYFTSDRPGGSGGRDLYTSKRSPLGEWSKAVNMGPTINTPFDEDAPFIHADGITLSFSSNGHKTMGGFDIFTTVLSDDRITWSEPMNEGYPINTPDDDIFYVVSPDGMKAYFSSFRDGGSGEKDNYVITFLEKKTAVLTLVKGNILDETGNPAKEALITVTNNETGEIVGIYHANKKTGKFVFILTPGKNYNITYQSKGHLFNSENMIIPKESNYYEINRAVVLPPIIVGSKITLNNIFFDFDKATLRPISNVELKNLVTIMKANPNMKVQISGHTDNKGDVGYNQKLSEERAQAVVSSLIVSGIDGARMKAKGYGETKPSVSNTHSDGSDDPEGRQLNRRVELEITEIK